MAGEGRGGTWGRLALSATKAWENNICAKYFTAKFSRQEEKLTKRHSKSCDKFAARG